MNINSSEFLIGIDVGTTSVKGVLLNEEGSLMASVSKEYLLETGPGDTCEVDPEVYWQTSCSLIRELVSTSQEISSAVKGISFSSQGETLIVVDKKGKPLRKAIVWLDNRSFEEAHQIEEKFGPELICKVTGQPEIVPTWPATKIRWMATNEPEIFCKTSKFLLVEDYLIYKLTGEYCTEYSLVSSTLYFDINSKKWWPEMLEYLSISEGQLPRLNNSGTPVGPLTPEASQATGLTVATICVTGAYDHPAGAIGAGCIKPGSVTLTIGTSMAMCVPLAETMNVLSLKIPCQCHALPGLYFLLPYGQTAGMVLKWFRDEFCLEEKQNAINYNLDPYDLLVQKASEIPTGSDGLIVLPHLMGAGSPEFNPNARGVFFGIKMGMSKAHITRAILESVAYMVNRNIEILRNEGIEISEIQILGGGSKSPLWVQIISDVTGIPVNTLMGSDHAAMGAALIAGTGIGIFENLTIACLNTVKPLNRYSPNQPEHQKYKNYFTKYSRLYNALAQFWGEA
jgi:D-xylulose kinase